MKIALGCDHIVTDVKMKDFKTPKKNKVMKSLMLVLMISSVPTILFMVA